VLQGTASAEERLVFERKMSRSGAEKPLN